MNFNNAIRTIAALLAGVIALATTVGECLTSASGVTVCSASWLTPQVAAYLVAGLTWGAVILKAVRPGGMIAGMFGETAIVSTNGQAGTVPPNMIRK